MSRSFAVGDRIQLTGSTEISFRVLEILGAGGTCVAYKVAFEATDGSQHLGVLKEYCPAFLGVPEEDRGKAPALSVPKEHEFAFRKGIEEFAETYRKISDYLFCHDRASNCHTVPLGLYYGNGTVYSLCSRDYGKRYDQVQDPDAKSVLRVVRSLAIAISQYHEAGYLHLDIKPENILILDGVTELVKLFDYDSLTQLDKIRAREVCDVPQPGVYYVPELREGNLRAIGISTDIFEIGALLFLRLFHRAPEPYEMETGAVYPWDDAPLLAGITPQAKYELEQLFKNTLQISVRKRYQSDDELLKQIETVLGHLQEQRPYLLDLPRWQPSACCLGRGEELDDVRAHLQRDGFVFLRGMGGIGKSELAKQYAKRFAQEYHTVQFCRYMGSLEVLTASIPVQGMNDTDFSEMKELAAEKEKLLHQCDCHTLLIVDNFNVTFDAYLREFLPANGKGFHVIFTTRCTPAQDYYAPAVLQIMPLSEGDCLTLFNYHYGKNMQQDEDALTLIRRIEYNPLLIQLTAKAMKRAHLTPAQMLEQIEVQTVAELLPEIFYEYDCSDEEAEAYNRLYGHLNTVFSVTALSRAEKDMLKCLTLIPPDGLPESELLDGCADFPELTAQLPCLEALGWISSDETRRITMHQIVSDVLSDKPELPVPDAFAPLFEVLSEGCGVFEDEHFTKAMKHLTTAIHLDRRCKAVCAEDRVDCKLMLGALYLNLYQAKNARLLLSEAEVLSRQNNNICLPYILLCRAQTEARFGLPSDAATLLEQTVVAGQTDLGENAEAVLRALCLQAELLEDNNENRAAMVAYERAIAFASGNGLTDALSDVYSACEALCGELDEPALLQHYRSLSLKQGQPTAAPQEEAAVISCLEQGQISAAQREYACILEHKKEILGEESPIYRDAERARWILSAAAGDKEQALRELSEAEEFVMQYYGESSAEMAELLSYVSRVFPDMNEFTFASDAAARAMHILEKQHCTYRYAYARAALAQAQICLLIGRNAEAERYVSMVNFDAYDGTAYLSDLIRSAGFLLCEISRFDEALTLSRRVLAHNEVDPVSVAFARVVAGTCYEQQGMLTQAEEVTRPFRLEDFENYDSIELKRGLSVMYRRLMSRMAYRKGDCAEAIRQLDILLEEDPDREEFMMHRVFSERSLFYGELGNFDQAKTDFLQAEAILNKYHVSADAYQLLYNNISALYENRNEPECARIYLERLIHLCPQVLQPRSYLDAMCCQNIGWNAVLLGELTRGEALLNRALDCMKQLKAEQSIDYLTCKRNLGLLYIRQTRFSDAIRLYREIVSGLKSCSGGEQTTLRAKTAAELFFLLEHEKHASEAQKFADDAADWLSALYGGNSPMFAELLLQMIGYAIEEGDGAALERLLDRIEPVFSGSSCKGTALEARWLNFLGVYCCDALGSYGDALKCFSASARLWESLNETDNELYPVVLENIKYVRKRL